jgi:hypothetical protein
MVGQFASFAISAGSLPLSKHIDYTRLDGGDLDQFNSQAVPVPFMMCSSFFCSLLPIERISTQRQKFEPSVPNHRLCYRAMVL